MPNPYKKPLSLWQGVQAPLAYLVTQRYERLGLHQWTNARLAHLAQMMHCTPLEVCAYVGISGQDYRRRWRRDKWPMDNGLMFMLLENFWLETYRGIVKRPVISLEDLASREGGSAGGEAARKAEG